MSVSILRFPNGVAYSEQADRAHPLRYTWWEGPRINTVLILDASRFLNAFAAVVAEYAYPAWGTITASRFEIAIWASINWQIWAESWDGEFEYHDPAWEEFLIICSWYFGNCGARERRPLIKILTPIQGIPARSPILIDEFESGAVGLWCSPVVNGFLEKWELWSSTTTSWNRMKNSWIWRKFTSFPFLLLYPIDGELNVTSGCEGIKGVRQDKSSRNI